MAQIRIDKYLCVALGITRSEAKFLIKSGNITVDGIRISKSDFKFDDTAEVKNADQPLTYKKHLYIMMNKPEGILSASSDKRVKTVVDILPDHLKREGLFPVGRLDKNTTGLLILTDDGDFGHRVMSPKSGIEKTYIVTLDGPLAAEHIRAFEEGITLADGTKCLPAKLHILSQKEAQITISEGKYHQIKRMFGTVGLGVDALRRKSVGGLILDEKLSPGEVRELTEAEKQLVFKKNTEL